MERKFTIKKLFSYLSMVQQHRKWVRYYCSLAGIRWRGLVHDLSKYSPTELIENVKYWEPGISPIRVAKQEKGVSFSWLHHRGRNPHHPEYWVDDFNLGCKPKLITEKYFTELVCDYLAAAHTYQPNTFTYKNEYEWWQMQRDYIVMHENNKIMLDTILADLAVAEKYKHLHGFCSPEKLIKTRYIQQVWHATNNKNLPFIDI